jgi:DUF971 family protein
MHVAGSTQPVEIELRRSAALRIRWADGVETTIPLAILRKSCPCASCRTAREEQTSSPLTVLRRVGDERAMVTAVRAELVGHYALRIVWNDGHDTGIYDYALLRTLGESGEKSV